jgi:hypothetical protein
MNSICCSCTIGDVIHTISTLLQREVPGQNQTAMQMTADDQCTKQCLLLLQAVQNTDMPHESCPLHCNAWSLRLVTMTFPQKPMRKNCR